MIRLIFLDIDGVLNDHGCDPMSLCGEIHSGKVRLLNRLLFCTGAQLVLSSAWRYIIHRQEANIVGMDWLLRSHGLHAGRMFGVREGRPIPDTPHGFTHADTMVRMVYDGVPRNWPAENERGSQIQRWIDDLWVHRKYGEDLRHVVIDDLDLGISAAGHPFVRTNGKIGLTDNDVDRAIMLFADRATSGAE